MTRYNFKTRTFENVVFFLDNIRVVGTASELGIVWIGKDIMGDRYVVKCKDGEPVAVLVNGKRIYPVHVWFDGDVLDAINNGIEIGIDLD